MIANIETSKGRIVAELYDELAPKTVNNFKELVSLGFYTNLVFHRIVKNFVIQSGDPITKNGGADRSRWGTGGASKTVPLEIAPSLHNQAGTLGMARSQDPNSASSQFYINLSNNTSLDGKYAVFGKVTSGMDVVHLIASVPVDGNDAPFDSNGATLKSISIE